VIGEAAQLFATPILRGDVWRTVRRSASDAGIETAIGCHTFRSTGITDYLANGERIEVAQRMAGHSKAKITGLYDRRNNDISIWKVERIGIESAYCIALDRLSAMAILPRIVPIKDFQGTPVRPARNSRLRRSRGSGRRLAHFSDGSSNRT
jgi:hypothetical protein